MRDTTVKFKLKDGSKSPQKANSEDFGTDLYLAEDALIVPGMTRANLVGTGIKTEFDSQKNGMIITLRSSMSLIPISLANHIGIIEGSYRGEIKLTLRNTIPREIGDTDNLANYVLEWDETTKSLIKKSGEKVPTPLWEEMKEDMIKDEEVFLLGEPPSTNIREGQFPVGTILLNKGTRVVQSFLSPKVDIEWKEVDKLSNTYRGTGGFGSTNVNGGIN